jgi:hypothetical protein
VQTVSLHLWRSKASWCRVTCMGNFGLHKRDRYDRMLRHAHMHTVAGWVLLDQSHICARWMDLHLPTPTFWQKSLHQYFSANTCDRVLRLRIRVFIDGSAFATLSGAPPTNAVDADWLTSGARHLQPGTISARAGSCAQLYERVHACAATGREGSCTDQLPGLSSGHRVLHCTGRRTW